MAETTEEYFARVCKENGLSDAQIQAVMAPVQKMSGDFNAMQGRATAAQKRTQDLENWYPTANAEYQRLMQEKQALETALSAGTPLPTFDTSKFYSREDVNNLLNERDKRYAGVIKDSARIASEHAAVFKEAIDVDAIEKIAFERNVPLRTAYELYVAPRVKEQSDRKAQEDREAYAKQAVAEYASKHNLPTDPNPPTTQSFLHHKPNPADIPQDLDAELVAAWRGAIK